jgi:hypothetical protein
MDAWRAMITADSVQISRAACLVDGGVTKLSGNPVIMRQTIQRWRKSSALQEAAIIHLLD